MSLESTTGGNFQVAEPSPHRRSDNLALALQEMFTVIVRLRSDRQTVTDAETFRANTLAVLTKAEQEAGAKGYNREDIRLASFAVVAFLDESVLNSRNPVFADWPRKPVQVELFGSGVAGEIFFRDLDGLLNRRDSRHLADLLEVYYLCLLLGYKGRQSSEGSRSLIDSLGERIRRIRGSSRPLATAWTPPAEALRAPPSDPWVRGLIYATLAGLLLAAGLLFVFKISLSSATSQLSQLSEISAQDTR